MSEIDNGDVKYFYYQGDVLLYAKDSNGNKTSQNIVGPQGNIIATIRFDNGEHAYFYNKDIRTSVTNVIDETGAGVVSYTYDDYGTTTKHGDQSFYNDICYTSGVYDELTGQYYLNARYYDPAMGTFITQDSYRGEMDESGTWNMYAYCGGNPVNYVDPSGHMAETALGAYGVANCWNPTGWAALFVDAVIISCEIYVLYEGVEYLANSNITRKSETKNKTKVAEKSKPKIRKKIARRKNYNSKKKAYEAAKKAGKGKEPVYT